MTNAPQFQPTVLKHVYQAVVSVAGMPFADSYLWGADLSGSRLTPRTLIACERLTAHPSVMDALTGLNISIAKPAPWPGKDGRAPSWKEALPFTGWPEDRPTVAPPLFREHATIDDFLRGDEPSRR